MDWAAEPSRFDQVIERDGARVFVDPKSAVFLAGTVVDWQQTLMQSGFVFRNPNVKTRLQLRRVLHDLTRPPGGRRGGDPALAPTRRA